MTADPVNIRFMRSAEIVKTHLQINIVEPPMPADTLEILTFCDGDTSAVLMAPDGFSTISGFTTVHLYREQMTPAIHSKPGKQLI
jgi:hypothetical protein